MIYQYSFPKQARKTLDVPSPTRETKEDFQKVTETFTGQVQGKKASDLEERFARALQKRGISFTFRLRLSPLFGLTEVMRNDPGEIEIDMLAQHRGELVPIQIDGQIAHFYAAWQRDVDMAKDASVNHALEAYGARKVIRLKYDQIWTSKQCDNVVREIFL